MRRTLHRKDGNHDHIRGELEKVTKVYDVHNGDLGCDLIARHLISRAPIFLEIKDPAQPPSGRTLTEKEEKMRQDFVRYWFKVETLDQALAAIGVAVRTGDGPKRHPGSG